MKDPCRQCPYKEECRELRDCELTCEEVKAYAEIGEQIKWLLIQTSLKNYCKEKKSNVEKTTKIVANIVVSLPSVGDGV